MLVVRFRVYAPNGAALGILPHPLSWEAGLPLNDMTSLTMTYPDGSDAADMLKDPCEVALELRNPATGVFTEHPGCRFLNIRRSVDMGARPRILSFTMPSYGWQLKKVRFIKADNPNRDKNSRVAYAAITTPSKPILDLLAEAKGRDNIPGLTYNFTETLDTLGVAWGVFMSRVTFDFGQDAWSIVDSLSKQGFFDWRFDKRELELFKVDTTLRRMLDTDTGVHIHSMLASTEEPVERTWEDLAARVVAMGDNNVIQQREAPPGITLPWGAWDETVNASGVTDRPTLLVMANRLLQTKYKSRTQYTKRFVWTEGAPIPLVDYRPGDFVRATSDATTGSQKASMRVYQITLSGTDPYGVSVGLTLNDRFTDRALQTERWVARSSSGGGPVGGGGTGGGSSKPQPPPVDSTPPKAPTLNTVVNAPYFSELGDPVSTADVAFTVVTEDINDEPIDVVRYNVSARRSDHTDEQARVVQVRQPNSPSTGQVIHAKIPLLDSGYTYTFAVQAIRASGYTSDWSNAVSQAMQFPLDAPEVPSAPILSSKLGTVKAEWDGKDNAGLGYESSFREVQVEVSTNGTTWFHAGDIFSPGSALIMSGKGGSPTWSIGDTVYVRFKARNSAAVISPISATSQIVVVGVVGPDIAANSIEANHVVAGTLTAEQIKAHSLTVESLSVGNPANLVVDPQFTSSALNLARLTQAGQSSSVGVAWTITSTGSLRLDNNTTSSTFSRFGFTNNSLLNYPLITHPGPVLASPELVVPVNRPGATTGVSGNIKARFVVTVTGIPASPGPSTVNVAMLARQFQRSGASNSTSGVIISDNTLTVNGTYTIEANTGLAVASGIVGIIPYLYVKLENGVSADVALEFSQIEIWQESSVFIGDGMVRAPHISANAVTTDKLDAEAITAKHSIRSAYYEMVSQSGAATVKITENANQAGQSGIRWDGLMPAGGSGPRVFQADSGGTGGWDPNGFVITGPEQVVNSSGRIDLSFNYGVTGSKIARAFGPETFHQQGIYWDTGISRFRIGGSFNTGQAANDMFRLDRMAFQNGTYSYGVVTIRRYYPIITGNSGSTPTTTSILDFPSGAEGGFRYVSDAGTTEIYFLAINGTP